LGPSSLASTRGARIVSRESARRSTSVGRRLSSVGADRARARRLARVDSCADEKSVGYNGRGTNGARGDGARARRTRGDRARVANDRVPCFSASRDDHDA
jgi:hypothetical protein